MPQSPRSVLLALTGLDIDGGIASVSRCVATALDECIDAGTLERVDRVLLLSDSGAPPGPKLGVQRLARGSQARFLFEAVGRVLAAPPDLVFFDHVGLARTASLPWSPVRRSPYAVFVHGGELDAAGRGHRRRALAGAARVLANSPFTAERVRRDFPEVAERVHIVQLCIDPDRWRRWERGLAAHGGSEPRRPAALIVGRMAAEERGKGHDSLIAAWPAIRSRVPASELWIVGGGDDRPRLERLAEQLGVADAVHFWGRVSDDELQRLYLKAAVFAMPSRQEGFGLVYAEAMLHGLPCVGSDADAAGTVIRDGETGVLVPFGDVPALESAIAGLFLDPARALRLGAAGTRRARERYTYPRFRAALLEALGIDRDSRGNGGASPG